MIDNAIGIIPAAGKGVRLGLPYPKELYPIIRENRYKPVSQFVLDNLVTAGVSDVVFVINESKHQLLGYFGDGHRFGCHISYVVQEVRTADHQSTSPGLAHALDSAFRLAANKTVFFGMADTLMEPRDVFARAWATMDTADDVALVLFPTTRPEKFGMVRLANDNVVVEVHDKPRQTTLTQMWGCIIWRPRFTAYLHDCVRRDGVSDFARILNGAIAQGMRVRGVPIDDGTYADLGTYEEILELDATLRQP
ncbi:MAG: sugar phosphate nucleotidyltransferase [Vicinamibacterales bacterium]